MRRWRQTFITFQPQANTLRTQECPLQETIPKPAVLLPPEIWALILSTLSTISLKVFRLVCRYWAGIGSELLFDTVYVDSYMQSWERLGQLSLSEYGQKVKAIKWNALALPSKPLDVTEWHAQYPNLLRGVNHISSARLYEAYRHCVKSARLLPFSEHDQPKIAFSRFPNLQTLIMEDDVDLECQCDDADLRANVQRNVSLHESVAMWGHSPLIWPVEDDNEINDDYFAVFMMFNKCSTLVRCRASLWDSHWRQIADHNARLSCGAPWPDLFSHPTLFNAQFVFKYCDAYHGSDLNYRTSIVRAMQKVLQDMGEFPRLESLTIEARPQDPGPAFRQAYKEVLHFAERLDDDHDWSCEKRDTTCDCFCGISVAEMDRRYSYGDMPNGLDEEFLHSLEAIFLFSPVTMASLKSLTLNNTTLDLKCLVAWLCQQPSNRSQELTIFFRGYVIVYGFDIETFYRLMSSFHVRIVCDGRVLFYETEEPLSLSRFDPKEDVDHFWYEEPRKWSEMEYLFIRLGAGLSTIETLLDKVDPITMAPQNSIGTLQIVMVHQPLSLKELFCVSNWTKYIPNILFYCMVVMDNSAVKFFWTKPCEGVENMGEKNKLYLLLVARGFYYHEG